MEASSCLLLADADQTLTGMLACWLPRFGYQVLIAEDSAQMLRLWRDYRPAIIVLDWWLPGLDGGEVVRQIRAQSGAFLFVLTEPRQPDDEERALEAGADRFLAKPLRPRAFLAWLAYARQAVQRATPAHADQDTLVVGAFCLDRWRRWLRIGERGVKLGGMESRLLSVLLSRAGQVVPTHALIDALWGKKARAINYRRGLRAYIYLLRQKIETDPRHPRYLLTAG